MQPPNIQYAPKVYTRPKRPIDKAIQVQSDTIGTTQVVNILRTSTVAETFTGGHISGTCSISVAGGAIAMALMYVKSGQNTPVLSVTDGANITPESAILWIKLFQTNVSNSSLIDISANIKTMRKMQTGDQIIWTAIAGSAAVGTAAAIITTFYKQ
jgi:hypothetical protein